MERCRQETQVTGSVLILVVILVVMLALASFAIVFFTIRGQGAWGRMYTKMRLHDHVTASSAMKKTAREWARRLEAVEKLNAPDVKLDMTKFLEMPCPICSHPMMDDEEIAVCVDCAAAYHLICVKDNKGCAKPRCDSYVYLYPSGELMRWRRAVAR